MTPFVLAHLSDPHLAPLPKPRPRDLIGKRAFGYVNWTRNRRKVQHGDTLDRLVADLRAQRPDHVAVTGDLVNLALAEEFAPAAAWLATLGAPADVTAVPGNHDAYVRATRHLHQRDWAAFMRGDGAAASGLATFPFVRRRGPLALIGVSTALPTPPLMATGRLGARQLGALDRLLPQLGAEGACRVLLIHHPLQSGADRWQKRLTDAPALRDLLRRHGVELVLHGHDHRHSLTWFDGPEQPFPAVGVPSASAGSLSRRDPAAYNLLFIDRDNGWRIAMATRGLRRATDGASAHRSSVVDLRERRLLRPD
jgi:3',5'-cyclic AMP phosphodiesterase CpdA